MDGFLMVISTDCKILYLSETVHDHLGLNWVRSQNNLARKRYNILID